MQIHPSGDLLYVAEFFSADEETAFLSQLAATPMRWTQLRHRRVMNVGGKPDPKGMIPEAIPDWVMHPVAERLHALTAPVPASTDAASGEPGGDFPVLPRGPSTFLNHVFINDYEAPHGILAHEDGPLYAPVVCIVSLAGTAPLVFYRKRPATDDGETPAREEVLRVLLEPRSLVVFRGSLYTDCLHEVPDAAVDEVSAATVFNFAGLVERGVVPAGAETASLPRPARRVSVTYRRVPKVAKLTASALFGKR